MDRQLNLVLPFQDDDEIVTDLLAVIKSPTLSKAAKIAEVSRMLRPYGIDIAPMQCEQTTWTATEIATELGVSAALVGRIANQHHLKNPEYGEFRLSQSRSSSKQVETFCYFDAGRKAIIDAVNQRTNDEHRHRNKRKKPDPE